MAVVTPLWRHEWRSIFFISHAHDVKREIRFYTPQLLANQKLASAPRMWKNIKNMEVWFYISDTIDVNTYLCPNLS